MRPEDVKISHAVPWPVQPGIIIPEQYIPAHEVGAIIKAAVEAGQNFGWLDADEYTQKSIDRICTKHRRWLEKANELENMK